MKVFELREKSRQELVDLLNQLHKEKFNLLLRRGAQELPNPLRMRTLRRDIARIETVLREDDLGTRKLLEPKKTPVKGKGQKEKDKGQKAKNKNK
jgi:large subunit ribosomal protein L29